MMQAPKQTIEITSENCIGKNNLPQKVAFKPGLVLFIDKPKDWTSFDVVNKVRYTVKYKLGVKKIKVGHAGTLDPMATGLLILCIGKYTKKIDSLTSLHKSYEATLQLGATTPSYDAESEIDHTFPTDHISAKDLDKKLEDFRGFIDQIPPMYSAIKVGGQKLYNLARKGKTIERKSRRVEIRELRLLNHDLPSSCDLYVDCSKGTYIRSLAHDYGASLGSGAHLSALRRLSIGDHLVENALTIEEAIQWIEHVESTDVIDQ